MIQSKFKSTSPLLLFFISILFIGFSSSCNRAIYKKCKAQYKPQADSCKQLCILAQPNIQEGETKEEAIKRCEKECDAILKNQTLNCYHSEVNKCIRQCARQRARECRREKRTCRRNARLARNRCKRQCRQNFRSWRQIRARRRCIRNCKTTFRAARRQCNSVNCKKSNFTDECTLRCQ